MDLIIIPWGTNIGSDITLRGSEIRALRRNQKTAAQKRDDGDKDYGLLVILFDPVPGEDREIAAIQIWYPSPAQRDNFYDQLCTAMEQSDAEPEEPAAE